MKAGIHEAVLAGQEKGKQENVKLRNLIRLFPGQKSSIGKQRFRDLEKNGGGRRLHDRETKSKPH